ERGVPNVVANDPRAIPGHLDSEAGACDPVADDLCPTRYGNADALDFDDVVLDYEPERVRRDPCGVRRTRPDLVRNELHAVRGVGRELNAGTCGASDTDALHDRPRLVDEDPEQ